MIAKDVMALAVTETAILQKIPASVSFHMPSSSASRLVFPLAIREGEVAAGAEDLGDLIIQESDEQVEQMRSERDLDVPDFEQSCDALNSWRMLWRCEEEWGKSAELNSFWLWLKAYICSAREYDGEEFDLALEATKERVRCPFGLQPLELAYKQMKRQPIRLLDEQLQGRRLLTEIAGLAIHLSRLEYKPYILLPVENLRSMFGCRKVAITGAILTLIQNGILEDTGAKYGTKRARQFYCKAEPGVHYEEVREKKRKHKSERPEVGTPMV